MEHLRAQETLSTPQAAKAYLNSLDYDGFRKWIDLVNGVETGTPKPERGKVGNSGVVQVEISGTDLIPTGRERVMHRPPYPADRNVLLRKAFEKAKEIDDPEIAGLTLGLAISEIHYFEDGNGRTARLVYTLLSRGYSGSEDDKAYYSALLEETRGRDIVFMSPEISGIRDKILSEMFEWAKDARFNYRRLLFNGHPLPLPTHFHSANPDVFEGKESIMRLLNIDDIQKAMLYQIIESGGHLLGIISLMMTFPPNKIAEYVKKSGRRAWIRDQFLQRLTVGETEKWWENHQGILADIY